jgi:predicted ATPase
MKLTIKNIGVIKEADIELSGLTVIAGENDSGKSTVGKLMFSITKGLTLLAPYLARVQAHWLINKLQFGF